VIDGYFEFAPDLKERNDNWKHLASTSQCEKIEALAPEFNTNYFFLPGRRFNDLGFKNGIMEADDCPAVSAVYQSNNAKIFQYN
jgi:hypothetical protein